MQLWVVWNAGKVDAVGITELATYPGLKVCRIVICVGEDHIDWLPLIVDLEGWAKSFECQAMQNFARPGWERPLKAYGYEKTHVVLEKGL